MTKAERVMQLAILENDLTDRDYLANRIHCQNDKDSFLNNLMNTMQNSENTDDSEKKELIKEISEYEWNAEFRKVNSFYDSVTTTKYLKMIDMFVSVAVKDPSIKLHAQKVLKASLIKTLVKLSV